MLVLLLTLTTTVCLAAPAWNDRTTYRDYDYPARYDDRTRDGKRPPEDYAAAGPIGEYGSRGHYRLVLENYP